MDLFNPAAQVRSAADLRIMFQAIRAKLSDAYQRRRGMVDAYREVGLMLLKAKREVKHGQWGKTLQENLPAYSERELQRYMALADVPATDDLLAAWDRITGRSEEKANATPASDSDEPDNSETDEKPKKKRGKKSPQKAPGSTGNGQPTEESDSPFVDPWECPEDLGEVLADVKRYEELATRLRNLQKKFWSLEKGAAWKTLGRWERSRGGGPAFTKRSICALITALAHELEQMTPAKLCVECKGIPESEDNEPCPTCRGRGYLLACEVKKENQNGQEA